MLEFLLTFAPENKISFKEVRKATNKYFIFSPNTILNEDAYLEKNQIHFNDHRDRRTASKHLYKVKAFYDYSEGLHARIQSTICNTEDDMDVRVPSIDIASLISIS